MENLKDYGSDSDEDDKADYERDTSACVSNSLNDNTSSTTFADLKALASESVVSTSEQNISSSNLLGLENIKKLMMNNIYVNSCPDSVNPNENRKVQTSNGTVEIPDGDFWRDFTPCGKFDVANPQTCHDEYYKRQMNEVSDRSGVHQERCPINSTSSLYPQQKSRKRQYKDQSITEVPLSHELQDSAHYRHPSSISHINGPQTAEMCNSQNQFLKQVPPFSNDSSKFSQLSTCQEKRKVYYIHSKVSPYLASKLANKCARKQTSSWPVHDGVVNRLVWNVSNYSHLLLSAGMDAAVRVWNVWSSLDRCVATIDHHKKAVKHAEWCQTGRKILSCSYDRTAQITDVDTGQLLGECEHTHFVTAGCFHPANPNMFVTGTNNMILMWDMRKPAAPVKCFCYRDKFGQVQDLLFIRDGQELVSCSDHVTRDSADRSIMAWDLRSGVVLSNQIFQERYTCTRLKLHPSESHFMAQTQGGYVAIFSTSAPYKMDKSKRYEGHKMQGYGIGFDLSADGSLVYSGSAEDGVHCYDQRSGHFIRKLPSGRDIIIDVTCHPVLPSLIASCTWGGSISLWQ